MDDCHFGYKQKFQTKTLGEIIIWKKDIIAHLMDDIRDCVSKGWWRRNMDDIIPRLLHRWMKPNIIHPHIHPSALL